ncbi:MAG: hypothetical protein ABW092_12075 [Candidatus Thiodiazotropha sp.]
MKLLSTIAIFTSTLFIAACSSYEIKSATAPISESRSNLVIDGKTTKTEIIAMFGEPNGFLPSADNTGGYGSQLMLGNYHSNLLHYKDCTMREKSKIGIFSAGISKAKKNVLYLPRFLTKMMLL